MSKKPVKIRLNGDSTQKYNFGENGEEKWLDGGTELEVPSEKAKELVSKRIAHYADGTTTPTNHTVKPNPSDTNMQFDQDTEPPQK
jgi:hypothetical protein